MEKLKFVCDVTSKEIPIIDIDCPIINYGAIIQLNGNYGTKFDAINCTIGRQELIISEEVFTYILEKLKEYKDYNPTNELRYIQDDPTLILNNLGCIVGELVNRNIDKINDLQDPIELIQD